MSSAGHYISTIGNFTFNVDTIITMWISMGIVIIVTYIATRNMGIIPTKMQLICEKVVEFFSTTTESMMGEKENKRHIPVLASLFLFIVTANLIGQIPWRLYHLKTGEFASPTNDINVTGALAIIVLIYYLYFGIRKKGIKFFFHSLNPIDIIVGLVEILEIVIRPFTLALRLFANILAGELLVVAFVGIFAYLLPLPIMFFELFVGFVQALVFMMLSTAYVALAIEDNGHK